MRQGYTSRRSIGMQRMRSLLSRYVACRPSHVHVPVNVSIPFLGVIYVGASSQLIMSLAL